MARHQSSCSRLSMGARMLLSSPTSKYRCACLPCSSSLCQAKREQKKNRKQKKRIQDPRGLHRSSDRYLIPRTPLKFTPTYQLVVCHLPLWRQLRLCDVRAVTLVHITRLDLDQISMPVVMDHSWRWCSMPFSQQSTASPRRHATVTPVPDHCSTLACRCLPESASHGGRRRTLKGQPCEQSRLQVSHSYRTGLTEALHRGCICASCRAARWMSMRRRLKDEHGATIL
jgi:hypothetical protein